MSSAETFMSASVTNDYAIKGALQSVATFDFTPGYELDRLLKKDPELLKEFIKDPAAVAKREVGIILPKGWHMHFVNEKNEYMPPEGDALSQLAAGKSGKLWSRIEIRTAAGPGACVFCILCW